MERIKTDQIGYQLEETKRLKAEQERLQKLREEEEQRQREAEERKRIDEEKNNRTFLVAYYGATYYECGNNHCIDVGGIRI